METLKTVTMRGKEARRPGLVQLAVTGKITTAEGVRPLLRTDDEDSRYRSGDADREHGTSEACHEMALAGCGTCQ